MVQSTFNDLVGTTSNQPITLPAGTIPFDYIPAVNMYMPIRVIENGVGQLGLCQVNTDGSVEIYADMNGGSFGTNPNSGFSSFTLNWTYPY